MRKLVFILLALSACTSPRQMVADEMRRDRKICLNELQNGFIKTADSAIDCEAEQVLKTAQLTGFAEQDRLSDYYQARFALAKKIDKHSISLREADKQERQIDQDYNTLFNADNMGETAASIKPDPDMFNKMLLLYTSGKK